MNKLTRRTFVASISAAAVAPSTALRAADAAPAQITRAASPGTAYRFFDVEEARFIESACERLIPQNDDGPGAVGAHVARYLDEQLAGPWGAGHRPYRTGPWQPGTNTPDLSSSGPAAVFRRALRAINRGFETRGTRFGALDDVSQESFLRGLAAGTLLLDGVPAAAFLEMLLSMTVEGFFSGSTDARHRGSIAWSLRGFPGGHFRAAGIPEPLDLVENPIPSRHTGAASSFRATPLLR